MHELKELWKLSGRWRYHNKNKWGNLSTKSCEIKGLKCKINAKVWALSMNNCLYDYNIPPIPACWSCINQKQSLEFQKRRTETIGKKCKTCKIIKPIKLFTRTKNGWPSYCRDCASETIRTRNLIRDFNITKAQYNQMLAEQNHKCAICSIDESNNAVSHISRKPRKMALDHCHKTGKIRGILCSKCNIGLGYFSDDPIILTKAIEYLNKV